MLSADRLFLKPIPARLLRYLMMLRLGVSSAVERFDLVDFAKGSAVGPGAEKHAGDGKLAASPAIQAFSPAVFGHGEHGADRPFDFGVPIVFVEGGHGKGFNFEKR